MVSVEPARRGRPEKVQFLFTEVIEYRNTPRWVGIPWRFDRAVSQINEIKRLIPPAVEAWDGQHPSVRAPLEDPEKFELVGNVGTSWNYHDNHLAEITLLASETIHHLRAALDYLAYQMVLADVGKVKGKTQFPISTHPAKFRSELKSRLPGIRPAHASLVEAVQPYKGPTWAGDLARLSNRDKHRWPVDVTVGYMCTINMEDFYLDPLGQDSHLGYQIEEAELTFRFVDALGSDNSDLEVIPTLEGVLKGAVNLTVDVLDAYNVTEIQITRM